MAEAGLFDSWLVAAKTGRVDDLQELAKLDPTLINKKDHLGNTALHYAAGAGNKLVVSFLVGSPATTINAKNNVGDTPLHKAAWRNGLEMVKLLVKSRADLFSKNDEGQRPVDLATNPDVKLELTPQIQDVDFGAEDEKGSDDEGGDGW